MANDLTGSVDALASRTGLSGDAVAILMVVFGVLVLVFPALLQTLVGALLIIVGGVWLYGNHARRKAAAGARPPP